MAACSIDCLVRLTLRLRGDEVDELELLFAAPPAPPQVKPRKPTPKGGAS